MEKHLFPKVMVCAVASFVLMSGTSCVNEEFDMSEDNLNLEVTPLQDGVVLPLGSTDEIRLSDVLEDVDFEALKAGADGAYSISFSDEFDMSEELSSLKDMVKIEDVDFSRNISFSLNEADVSDVKIEEMEYSFTYDLSSSFEVPEFDLPGVTEIVEISAGMDRFVPEDNALQLNFDPFEHETHLMSISDKLHVPDELINDTPVSLEGDFLKNYMTFSDEFSFTDNTHITMSLPEGINSVNEILLHEGAAMKVTIELKKSFLVAGSIVPEIDIDLHNLFHLDASYNGDVAHLANDFVLSENNGYSQTKTYSIASLAVEPEDWKKTDSGIILDKDIEITAEGGLTFHNLMTTTRLFETNRDIDIYMSLEFINLQIDDVKMDVDPVVVSQEEEIEVSFDDIRLPEEIQSVNSVVFAEGSGLDIGLSAKNIERFKGLDLKLESLVLSFPENIKVKGADAKNQIVFEVSDLSETFSKHVEITGVDMPAPVNGAISFNEVVKMKAVAKASGDLKLSELPECEADDLQIAVDVKSEFEVADYEVAISGSEFAIDMEPELLSVELPAELKDTKEITIVPEGAPIVVIDLYMPETGVEIIPSSGKGLKISFPEMIRFKQLPSEYNYSLADNSITLRNELPSSILLPVEKVVLVPETDPVDGKVYARGETVISGALSVKPCVMCKADVEKFANSDAAVSAIANIPEMSPKRIEMDKFETSIREELNVIIIESEALLSGVQSIGVVELEDTYLNLSLDATKLPELGSASIDLEFAVSLPEMIKVSGVTTDENGNIILAGTITKKEVLAFPPIKIDALDLTDAELGEGVSGDINVDGTVSLSNASLDVSKWLGKDLNVQLNAGIKDVTISRMNGKIDYKVDPVVETIDLGDLVDQLAGSGVEAELDFCRAHIALEVQTNLGVAVNADMKLVPYYNGKADEAKAVVAQVALLPAASVSENKVTRIWMAGTDDDCPAGYEFVKADILSLLTNIPEKLEVRLEAGTDPSAECVIEPLADYTLSAAYRFELPLEFGEDLCITFRDTITGINEIVGKLISKGKIQLKGEVHSTLPFGLDLSLNMLDSNHSVVPMASGCGVQKICPCGLDASAVVTELDMMLALASAGSTSDISAIELVFKVTPSGVTGVPLKESSSLKADLSLLLPEGVTVDLKDLKKE